MVWDKQGMGTAPMKTNFDVVTEAFNLAAWDPMRWKNALDVLTKETRGYGSFLIPMSASAPITTQTDSLVEVSNSYLKDGWINRDERYRSVPRMKSYGVATDEDCISIDEMKSNPYWQEWLVPHGLKWFAGIKIAFGESLWCASVQRTDEQGPFTRKEAAILAKLSDHLSAAGALATALGFARLEGAMSAFDLTNTAIFMANARGNITKINETARKMLGVNMQLRDGRLFFDDSKTTEVLWRAINEYVGDVATAKTPAIFRLPRTDALPLVAYLTKPPSIYFDLIGNCRCIITIIDPLQHSDPKKEVLQIVFGLTSSEALLASKLSTGSSVEQAAIELGIAYQTARSKLKNIHNKMGINRNAELTYLVNKFL